MASGLVRSAEVDARRSAITAEASVTSVVCDELPAIDDRACVQVWSSDVNTFSFRYDQWCGWILGLLGSGRRFSRVTVGATAVDVQLGIAFRGTIARTSIRSAARRSGKVWGWGAHGWNGRWLVNGSSKGIVVLHLEPRSAARVLGFPVKVSELALSLEDPTGFCTALGLPLDAEVPVEGVDEQQ